MACFAVCKSGSLLITAYLSSGDHCSTQSGSSHQAIRCRKTGRAVPSLPYWKTATWASSPSRANRAQALDKTTSPGASPGVTDEGNGGGGGCPGCGKAEKLAGCNGEGRIQGGIGAIPGFGWLPIKAFRPCPAFIETGGRYRRIGQSLEEVAFGRKGAQDDRDISERIKG